MTNQGGSDALFTFQGGHAATCDIAHNGGDYINGCGTATFVGDDNSLTGSTVLSEPMSFDPNFQLGIYKDPVASPLNHDFEVKDSEMQSAKSGKGLFTGATMYSAGTIFLIDHSHLLPSSTYPVNMDELTSGYLINDGNGDEGFVSILSSTDGLSDDDLVVL